MKRNDTRNYQLYDNDRPKVLLLGNGIHRSFSKKSWDDFIDLIRDKDFYHYKASKYAMPMSLKADMLANTTNINKKIKEFVIDSNKLRNINSYKKSEREYYIKLFNLGFDYVLTTNYSYEIESALLEKKEIKKKDLDRIRRKKGVKRAQCKYNTNTFYEINNNKIYHIHGEINKPNSIILGNINYCRLLNKYSEYINNNYKVYLDNIKNRKAQKINSWIDAFLFGDIFIVGFGLDFSEIDIWFLLEYKKRLPVESNVIIYEPKNLSKSYNIRRNKKKSRIINEDTCKNSILINNCGYDVRNLNYYKSSKKIDYQKFYSEVYEDIRKIFI